MWLKCNVFTGLFLWNPSLICSHCEIVWLWSVSIWISVTFKDWSTTKQENNNVISLDSFLSASYTLNGWVAVDTTQSSKTKSIFCLSLEVDLDRLFYLLIVMHLIKCFALREKGGLSSKAKWSMTRAYTEKSQRDCLTFLQFYSYYYSYFYAKHHIRVKACKSTKTWIRIPHSSRFCPPQKC